MNTSVPELLKYALVGGISTFIHLVFAFLYIYYIDKSLFFSNFFGFCFAYCFSYFTQSHFVFKSKISLIKALKYFGLQLFALAVSIAVTSNLLSLSLYMQVLICVAIMPIITFAINKAWIF